MHSQKLRTLRSFQRIGGWVLLSTFLSSCNDAIERAAKADTGTVGVAVDQLVKDVGPPTVDKPYVQKDGVKGICDPETGVVRVLEYHVLDRGFARKVVEFFGGNAVSSMTVVCVNKDGRITSTHMVQF